MGTAQGGRGRTVGIGGGNTDPRFAGANAGVGQSQQAPISPMGGAYGNIRNPFSYGIGYETSQQFNQNQRTVNINPAGRETDYAFRNQQNQSATAQAQSAYTQGQPIVSPGASNFTNTGAMLTMPDGTIVPASPQAYRTVGEGSLAIRQPIYGSNGEPVPASWTPGQVQTTAQANNMSVEDFQSELSQSGYVQFGGTWVYNPTGGTQATQGQAGGGNEWWRTAGRTGQVGKKGPLGQTFGSEQARMTWERRQKQMAKEEESKTATSEQTAKAGQTTVTSTFGTG